MKHRLQLRRRRVEESTTATRSSIGVLERHRYFPPPDPSTRVEFELVTSTDRARRHSGELIVAAGVGAILVSACSKFVQLFDLPSLSEVSVAASGGALAVLGVLQHRRTSSLPARHGSPVAPCPVELDLPSLTGQLSALLADLRQHHGVVYTTRTWIEIVLPAAGADLQDQTLARDLLAAAALDAGGIRADVAAIAESHSRDDIVATSSALIEAVRHVLATCDQSTDLRTPRPSDPSRWPASAC